MSWLLVDIFDICVYKGLISCWSNRCFFGNCWKKVVMFFILSSLLWVLLLVVIYKEKIGVDWMCGIKSLIGLVKEIIVLYGYKSVIIGCVFMLILLSLIK